MYSKKTIYESSFYKEAVKSNLLESLCSENTKHHFETKEEILEEFPREKSTEDHTRLLITFQSPSKDIPTTVTCVDDKRLLSSVDIDTIVHRFKAQVVKNKLSNTHSPDLLKEAVRLLAFGLVSELVDVVEGKDVKMLADGDALAALISICFNDPLDIWLTYLKVGEEMVIHIRAIKSRK